MSEQPALIDVPKNEVATETKPDPIMKDPEAKRERKPPTKDRARGFLQVEIDGEKHNVTMKASGLTVRRKGRRLKETKPISEIVDFVIGQERLEFKQPASATISEVAAAEMLNTESHRCDDLLESCIEFIAVQLMEANRPGKHGQRLALAAQALQSSVEAMAPGRIAETMEAMR